MPSTALVHPDGPSLIIAVHPPGNTFYPSFSLSGKHRPTVGNVSVTPFCPSLIKISRARSPNGTQASHPTYCKAGSVWASRGRESAGRAVLRSMGPARKQFQESLGGALSGPGVTWEGGYPRKRKPTHSLGNNLSLANPKLIWLLNFASSILLGPQQFSKPLKAC